MTTATALPTTTPIPATLVQRPARPCLEMRWSVRQAPGTAPTLSARWVAADLLAQRRPVAA
jgi:hypothetical protein